MTDTNVIIVPGFGGDENIKIYQELKKQIGNKCHIFVPDWKQKSIKIWISEYEDFIKKNEINNFICVGFSLGAYIIACSTIKPTKTIYASICPFFEEDILQWTDAMIKPIKDVERFGTYFHKSNSIFIYGEKEFQIVKDSVKRLAQTEDVVYEITGVGHDLQNKKHFEFLINLVDQCRSKMKINSKNITELL